MLEKPSDHCTCRESGGCRASGTVHATEQTTSRKTGGASPIATELFPGIAPRGNRLSADEQLLALRGKPRKSHRCLH